MRSSGHVCAVHGCYNNQIKRKALKNEICREHSVQRKICNCNVYHLHRFPADPRLRQQWVAFVDREGFVPTTCSRVCSEHFIDGDRVRYPVPIHKGVPKRRVMPRKQVAALPSRQVEAVDRRTTADNAASQRHNIVFWHMSTGENVQVVSIQGESAGVADEEFLAKASMDGIQFDVKEDCGEAGTATVGRAAEAEGAGTQSLKGVVPSESNAGNKEPSGQLVSPVPEDMESEDAICFCQAVLEEPLPPTTECVEHQDAFQDGRQHVPSIVSSYSLATSPMSEPEVVTGDVFSENPWQPTVDESPAIVAEEVEGLSRVSQIQEHPVIVKEEPNPRNLLQEQTALKEPVVLELGLDSRKWPHELTIHKNRIIIKRKLHPEGFPEESTLQECLAQQSPAQQSLAQQSQAQQSQAQQGPAQRSSSQRSPAQESPAQEIPAVDEEEPDGMDQEEEGASSSVSPDHGMLKSLLSEPALPSSSSDQAAQWELAGLSDHGYCKSAPSVLRRRAKTTAVREALAQLPWWAQCTVQPT